MLALAAGAYVLALLNRMALGVAGTDAAERFDVGSGRLAAFTAVQLVVYLAMQIPAGLSADRFGPRRTLAVGVAIIGVGELVFALTTSLGAGLAARGLVGVGDALTFLNVLRLAHTWFAPRRQPLLAALIGVSGALGQVVATVPLEAALAGVGWTPTFLFLAALGGAYVLVPLLLLRDRPPGVEAPPRTDHAPIGATLRDAAARNGTRLGAATHLGLLGPFLVLSAIWGVPWLVDTQGIGRPAAATVLLLGTVAFGTSGTVTGLLAGPPARQRRIVTVALSGLVALWTVTLAWPAGTPPLELAVAAILGTGVAGGVSMLAFDMGRREAPAAGSGAATAIVNCGGFTAGALGALLVGLLQGADPDPATWRVALLPMLGFSVLGLAGVVRYGTRERSTERLAVAGGTAVAGRRAPTSARAARR